MADRPYVAELRQYIDAVNAAKGINWKDVFRTASDPAATENWLYNNYGMDRSEARRYALALASMRDSELTGNDVAHGGMGTQGMLESIRGAAPQGAAPQGPTPEDQERKRISDWIAAFTQEMSRDVGPGDPMFDSLTKLGAARASMGVGASGVRVGRGGLGELAIQQGAMNATQPYVMQRKGMAQQGLGMLDQRDRGLESLRQGAQGLELQRTALQNQLDAQRYGAQADAAGGLGGTLGGLGGAVLGGVLTAATGGAAAPAIPGLIAGGSQLGAGWGQMGVQRPQYRNYRPYGSFGGQGGGF